MRHVWIQDDDDERVLCCAGCGTEFQMTVWEVRQNEDLKEVVRVRGVSEDCREEKVRQVLES